MWLGRNGKRAADRSRKCPEWDVTWQKWETSSRLIQKMPWVGCDLAEMGNEQQIDPENALSGMWLGRNGKRAADWSRKCPEWDVTWQKWETSSRLIQKMPWVGCDLADLLVHVTWCRSLSVSHDQFIIAFIFSMIYILCRRVNENSTISYIYHVSVLTFFIENWGDIHCTGVLISYGIIYTWTAFMASVQWWNKKLRLVRERHLDLTANNAFLDMESHFWQKINTSVFDLLHVPNKLYLHWLSADVIYVYLCDIL